MNVNIHNAKVVEIREYPNESLPGTHSDDGSTKRYVIILVDPQGAEVNVFVTEKEFFALRQAMFEALLDNFVARQYASAESE